MSRSRNYQKTRLEWGKMLQWDTNRKARAAEQRVIAKLKKDPEEWDGIIFRRYKHYGNPWDWD